MRAWKACTSVPSGCRSGRSDGGGEPRHSLTSGTGDEGRGTGGSRGGDHARRGGRHEERRRQGARWRPDMVLPLSRGCVRDRHRRPAGAAQRRSPGGRLVGDGAVGRRRAGAGAAPGGSTRGGRRAAPVRAAPAPRRGGALARAPRRARHDRPVGRPGGRRRPSRRGLPRARGARARAHPVLAGRGAARGRGERRRVRAARRAAAALWGPRGSRLSRRDGTRPHAHRRLQRGPRRTDDGPRAGDDSPSRLRSLPRAMIRTLWFYVVVVGSTILHATGAILAALLGVKHRTAGVYDWSTTDWSRDILRAAGTPVRLEGRERIPRGPVVYASNHSSMFDIWALAATLPGSKIGRAHV